VPERCKGKIEIPLQGAAPVSDVDFRRMLLCINWRLGFRQSSFHHITRASQRVASTSEHNRWFPDMLLSPCAFRLRVSHQAQELPLSSSRLNRGYNKAPAWRTARSNLAIPWQDGYGSLLDLAEACDVPVRWSCRTGVCHNCESGLLAGDVRYDTEPVDPPPDGNVLICLARPRGPIVLDL
jgi:hypothetical protein